MRISSNDEGVDLSNGLEVVVDGGDVRIMLDDCPGEHDK
jgi:hypothetical protein